MKRGPIPFLGEVALYKWLPSLKQAAKLLKLVHGTRCLVCGKVVEPDSLNLGCCPDCAKQLKLRTKGFCPSCGKIYESEIEPPYYCLQCRKIKRPWNRFGFFQAYKYPLKDVILDYKFNGELGYSNLLQSLLIKAYEFHIAPHCPEMILPVPSHSKRLQERGFNQCVEISRALASYLSVPIQSKAILRIKPTLVQSGLTPKQRRRNISGSIKAESQIVKNKNVLLVDDIYTTGATLNACCSSLLRSGVNRIDVLVLARASEHN